MFPLQGCSDCCKCSVVNEETVRFIGGWIGWRVRERSYMYMRTYARANNNKVCKIPPLKSRSKSSVINGATNQRVSKKFAESLKKVVANIWQICCKAVILRPLSREKRRWVEILNKGTETRTSALKNKFSKKTSKSFGSSKISLTFASAFEKKVFKEEFFERFRYEQASSTILT